MILDDLLIALIIAGVGISGAYLRAELLLHRRVTSARRLWRLQQLQLHTTGAQIRHNGAPVPTRDAGFPAHPLRTFAAVLAFAALPGCHGGLGGGCLLCGPFPTVQANLEGSLTGLVGSGLALQNNGAAGFQFNGSMANGKSVVFAVAAFDTSYDLTVQTQPTNPSQTCVVSNGTGMLGTADVTNITVVCATNPPRFAYVANRGSNNVSAYSVDAATGAMAAIPGSPFSVGNAPVAIAVDPTGGYAYVVNQLDSTISAFVIDRSSGVLNAVNGSPFATGSEPTSVAIDPTSTFVYVTSRGTNTVSVYALSASSGALTQITGSPFSTGVSPAAVTVNPLGFELYVANQSDGTIATFSIDNGALTPVSGSPFAAGAGPAALTCDPSGEYLYVADASANTLSGLAGGMQIAGSPYLTGKAPSSVAVNSADSFVYVVNQDSDNISAFALDSSTGALTALVGSPFAAGIEPSSVAVEPSGAFAYVVDTGSDSVSVFAIDATTGALAPSGVSPVAVGAQPIAIAISD